MYEPQLNNPPQHAPINISADERKLSLVSGVALILFALWRRNLLSIPALLAGLGLLYQSTTGNSPLYSLLDRNRAVKTNPARVSVPHEQGVHVTRAITIDRPVEDLYGFWRNLTNLPQVMGFVESVKLLDGNRSHWTLKLPGGIPVEFDSEVYTDTPNEVISWRSLPDSQLQHAGSVRFKPAPGNRGTELHFTLEFVPPGGPVAQAVLKLFGDVPNQYIGQFLRDFKQEMETGERATNKMRPAKQQEVNS